MPKAARLKHSNALLVGVIFLVAEVAFGLTQYSAPDRLFYFTSYSGQTSFRLNVTIGDHALTAAQIRERYHLSFRGRVDLTPEGLQQIIVHHERNYAKSDDVYVRMHVSRQRTPEEVWLWPQQ